MDRKMREKNERKGEKTKEAGMRKEKERKENEGRKGGRK
jgi:hypothetical protein